jgi:uncharacterized protein (TIGR02996 family)
MSPIDALYAAVHEDPTDDARRAVLADALVEQGDPRGEFIALQLEATKRELNSDERQHEQELRDAHEVAWLGPLGEVIAEAFWSRGFVSGVNLRADLIVTDAHAASPIWSTVEEIGLDGALAGSQPALRAVFERARSLSSICAVPGVLDLVPLATIQKLEIDLRLAELAVTMAAIERCAQLRWLKVKIVERPTQEIVDAVVARGHDVGFDSPDLRFTIEGDVLRVGRGTSGDGAWILVGAMHGRPIRELRQTGYLEVEAIRFLRKTFRHATFKDDR